MNGSYENSIKDCNLELEKIKKWIYENKFDTNVQFLVSYSVVKSCGTIEIVFKHMLFDALSQNCRAETNLYLTKKIIDASYNPKVGKIETLLGEMSKSWRSDFEQVTKATQQRTDLNSLVELRNEFAHGIGITASIENVISYFSSGVWILEKLNLILFNT